MRVAFKVSMMVLIVVAGFLLSILVMNLVGGIVNRTPEEIGVLYGLGQLVVWAGFIVVFAKLTQHLGDRPPT